ncbi:MAG: FtsX-like permease family protein [candidate division Zixibacteria bacterium]|nr:FtsX-like permease family protein [candidate division Zixibacteria bacterium]NIR65593.1 FtsX-like permease family protein [candidate division Zixibacteria bacterium]NIS15667.1 FtsX-like permease family protein [candidate division Zixibacteria bacterium]NIS47303.1 FtsX-like permease family protein [candidate division Zixibacteria bacterium]NIT52175.1 FtsX-like permease family protein [candidate division Zixibacteria bacterium]
MLFGDLLRLSFTALRAHKLRTFLTIFGIVIGVTSVIAIVSIVVGMNEKVTGLINNMGTTTFFVSKFGVDDYHSEDAFREARRRKDIKFRDVQAIEKDCRLCEEVGARTMTFRQLKHGPNKLNSVVIVGTTSNFIKITDFEVAEGRIHSEFEQDRYRQVALIGDKIREELYEGEDPIGKELKIGIHKFEIIGLAKPRGSMLGEDLDEFVIIPITTLLKNYGSHRSLDIFIKAPTEEAMQETIDQARVILRARRHVDFQDEDDFAVTTSEDWLEFYGRVTGTIQIVAIAIPLIALVVAGIVVMNIMMVSVTERTREIGIRKSLGARKRHIMLQFLSEALMMSLFGGALGIAFGILLAKVLTQEGDLPFVISQTAILGGIFISTGVGVIFGLYPAMKGARLDPVDAMRYE